MRQTQKRRLSNLKDRGQSLVNGALHAVANAVVYFVDRSIQPEMGALRAANPSDIVFERGKLKLRRLHGLARDEYKHRHEVQAVDTSLICAPLLLIPPLMVHPYVYDLRPEHSMLRTLSNVGFDVFTVDFGVPDRLDEGVRLDDYV